MGTVTEHTWRIVTADDAHPWPCTIVDNNGKSLLGIHNRTPIIRDRELAERIIALLNESSISPGSIEDGPR